MNCDTVPTTDPNNDGALPPEVRALLGVYALHTRVRVAIEDLSENDGLTDQARHLLVQLDKPRRLGDLARITNSLPSSVTALADLLESKGLAQRHRDERDRRAFLLSLTPYGIDLRSKMLQQASELFQTVTGLNDAQTRTFAELSDIVRKTIYDTTFQETSKC